MVRISRKKALGRGIPKQDFSADIKKLMIQGKPLLSDEDQDELNTWLNDFKRQRFGEQGYESWLSNHSE